MKLHRVTYRSQSELGGSAVQVRKFAASGDAASKMVTALKKDLGAKLVGKPERDEIDVPTTKTELINFLNGDQK